MNKLAKYRKIEYDDHGKEIWFCEKCGARLGTHHYYDDRESAMYCGDCLKEFIKEVPFDLPCGTVVEDWGSDVIIQYKTDYYPMMQVLKTCYFNSKGRYIKVKGKRYYV